MGSPCLFTRQQALKMGYFHWLRVKNSNHLHRELSLGYLKDTKFYLESKASFIHIIIMFHNNLASNDLILRDTCDTDFILQINSLTGSTQGI